jgi:hypothetical protein
MGEEKGEGEIVTIKVTPPLYPLLSPPTRGGDLN